MLLPSADYVVGLFTGDSANNGTTRYYAKRSSDGLTVYWYTAASADLQFNHSGYPYGWLILG